jgi:hypothetical protein
MTQLYRILYCSRNRLAGVPTTYPDAIQEILRKSRVNNASNGITGGLLFSEGCFAQVLEGPLQLIEDTFERIQCDDRHNEVTVVGFGPIETRDFPDWSMAFAGAYEDANPLTHGALSDVFSGVSNAGENVLRLLKQIIVREDHWLVPA